MSFKREHDGRSVVTRTIAKCDSFNSGRVQTGVYRYHPQESNHQLSSFFKNNPLILIQRHEEK